MSLMLANTLFNIVIQDGETARVIGNDTKLIVNPPRGALWFSQEDKMTAKEVNRQTKEAILREFKGRVLYAMDVVDP